MEDPKAPEQNDVQQVGGGRGVRKTLVPADGELTAAQTPAAEPDVPATAPIAGAPSAPLRSTVTTRSLRKRLNPEGGPGGVGSTVRSRPLATVAARPVVKPPVALPEPSLPQGPWRWRGVAVALAGLAWFVALTLSLTAAGDRVVAPERLRVVVGLAWAVAAAFTFVPIQWRLALSGVGWQGIFGWTLLGWGLTFVPPPTGSLFDLPDLPVYLLGFLALFYAVAAVVTPLAFQAGKLVFRDRLHRLDVGRARRQGYEAGLLAVTVLGMAGLRVLTAWTAVLVVIVVGLLETLLLSQVQPHS
ncbi:MAG: hypothetical protein NVS4B8_17340 [Herpetosiphon sp.]